MPVPTPLLLLLAAAVGATALEPLSLDVAEPVATAALVVILLDGGMDIGWRRMRAYAVPIAGLGVLGTFITAAVLALAARMLLGMDWTTAGLLGAALAPTDPAMVFSVLADRPLHVRSKTILEGEAGLNDPAGIALMLGMIELATHADASFTVVITEFVREMGLGLLLGAIGGGALRRLDSPLLVLAGAGLLYGAGLLTGGSGFLAVFVAGLLLRRQERIIALTGPAEAAVFLVLGATVSLAGLAWGDGVVLALVLGLVARPLAVVCAPGIGPGHRLFVAFCGLKGAVPLLLALYAAQSGLTAIYGAVFVAVVLNVLVQGTLVPAVSRLDVAAER